LFHSQRGHRVVQNGKDGDKYERSFMGFKKFRDMKVYERFTRREVVPEIRLQGKWLRELDFIPGTHITVKCEGGRLIITRRDEFIS